MLPFTTHHSKLSPLNGEKTIKPVNPIKPQSSFFEDNTHNCTPPASSVDIVKPNKSPILGVLLNSVDNSNVDQKSELFSSFNDVASGIKAPSNSNYEINLSKFPSVLGNVITNQSIQPEVTPVRQEFDLKAKLFAAFLKRSPKSSSRKSKKSTNFSESSFSKSFPTANNLNKKNLPAKTRRKPPPKTQTNVSRVVEKLENAEKLNAEESNYKYIFKKVEIPQSKVNQNDTLNRNHSIDNNNNHLNDIFSDTNIATDNNSINKNLNDSKNNNHKLHYCKNEHRIGTDTKNDNDNDNDSGNDSDNDSDNENDNKNNNNHTGCENRNKETDENFYSYYNDMVHRNKTDDSVNKKYPKSEAMKKKYCSSLSSPELSFMLNSTVQYNHKNENPPLNGEPSPSYDFMTSLRGDTNNTYIPHLNSTISFDSSHDNRLLQPKGMTLEVSNNNNSNNTEGSLGIHSDFKNNLSEGHGNSPFINVHFEPTTSCFPLEFDHDPEFFFCHKTECDCNSIHIEPSSFLENDFPLIQHTRSDSMISQTHLDLIPENTNDVVCHNDENFGFIDEITQGVQKYLIPKVYSSENSQMCSYCNAKTFNYTNDIDNSLNIEKYTNLFTDLTNDNGYECTLQTIKLREGEEDGCQNCHLRIRNQFEKSHENRLHTPVFFSSHNLGPECAEHKMNFHLSPMPVSSPDFLNRELDSSHIDIGNIERDFMITHSEIYHPVVNSSLQSEAFESHLDITSLTQL